MNTLSKQLKKLRAEKGITQRELAIAIKVPRDTVANWEVNRGTPNIETISDIADYFDVSIDYLLGRDKKKPFSSVAEPSGEYYVQLDWDPNDPIEKSTREVAQLLEEAVRLQEMTEEEALRVLRLAKEHIKIAKK